MLNRRKVGIGVLLVIIISLTVLMVLLGNRPASFRNPISSTQPKDDDKITLRMAFWANSQITVDKNAKVIALFEKAYPNIRVLPEYFWGFTYNNNIAIMASVNNLPDVIRIDYSMISEFIERDLLLPLDSYMEKKIIDMEGVSRIHNQGARSSGHTYGINIGNNALVMFYNPGLLAQAGVAPPEPGYTWEQFEADLRTIKRVSGQYGASHLTFQHFQVWLRQHGATLYNHNQTALGYKDDQLFSQFFDQQLRWEKEGIISPSSLEQNTKGLGGGRFPSGLEAYGAQTYWSNQAEIMEQQLGYPVGLAMYPGSGEKGMYIKPSFYHSIARTSKHPDEAALFINFYNNDIAVAKLLDGYFGFPYHPKVIASLEESMSPSQHKVKQYLKLVEQHGSIIDPPEPVMGSEVTKLFDTLQSKILYGEMTPEEGASAFRDKVAVILTNPLAAGNDSFTTFSTTKTK